MKSERMKSSKTKEDGPADETLVTITTPSSSSSASSPQNPSVSSPSSFPLDTPVWISRKEGPVEGRIAYKGPVSFAHGTDWIGVRLTGSSEGLGKNDGSVQGQSYFSCPPKCGLFVRQASLSATPPTSTTYPQQQQKSHHQQQTQHQQRTNTTTRRGAPRKTPPSTRLQRRRRNNQSLPEEPPAPFVGLTIEVVSPIPEPQPKDKDNIDETTVHKSDQQNTDPSGDGWTLTAPIMAPSSLERDIRYYSLTTCSSHASNLPLEDQTLASINVRNTHSVSSKQAQSKIMNGPTYLEYYEDDDDQSTIPSDDDDEDPQYLQSPTGWTTVPTREPLSSVQVVSPNIAQNNHNNHQYKPTRSTSPLPPPVMSPDKLERIAQRDRLQALEAWKKQKQRHGKASRKSTMMRV